VRRRIRALSKVRRSRKSFRRTDPRKPSRAYGARFVQPTLAMQPPTIFRSQACSNGSKRANPTRGMRNLGTEGKDTDGFAGGLFEFSRIGARRAAVLNSRHRVRARRSWLRHSGWGSTRRTGLRKPLKSFFGSCGRSYSESADQDVIQGHGSPNKGVPVYPL